MIVKTSRHRKRKTIFQLEGKCVNKQVVMRKSMLYVENSSQIRTFLGADGKCLEREVGLRK